MSLVDTPLRNKMHIIAKTDQSVLAKELLMAFNHAIQKVLEQKDTVVIAIPGGRSILPFFSLLLEQTDIAWSQTRWFMVDERMVSTTSQDSNYLQAKTVLFDPLITKGLLSTQQVFPFFYDPNSLDFGTKQYEETLRTQGGLFDIVLLGSGEDGHIAALFPEHNLLSSHHDGFLTFEDSPKPPAQRMTSSPHLITSAQYAFVLFIGSGKSKALADFKDEKIDIQKCPAKLALSCKECYLVTDL